MSQRDDSAALCVDLDGTLVATDLLYESLVQLLRVNPAFVFFLPFWLSTGRANLKRKIAERACVNVESLPFNQEVVSFLKQQREAGRHIVLATASDQSYANKIADYLGVFSEVIGSDGNCNLKGAQKARALSERFGEKNFEYAGDSTADLKVWACAKSAIVVHSNRKFCEKVRSEVKVTQEFASPRRFFSLLRCLRVYQWVKNLLVFIPLIMAHQANDSQLVLKATLGFFAFSLCASGVYVINDLIDIESDRLHPRKRHRPLAAGEVSILSAVALIPVLLAGAAGFACLVGSWGFAAVLGIYFLITSLYSLRLKQIAVLDIVVLASLYTIRIIGGGYAASVLVSTWLLGFSMFLFFSLACMKRFSELLLVQKNDGSALKGRGYRATDIEQIASFGSSSGFLAVLVMALYISSEEVKNLYSNPQMLWLLCPVLLYWISRVWLIARRDEMHDDPIVFALKDPISYIVGCICAVLLLIAS